MAQFYSGKSDEWVVETKRQRPTIRSQDDSQFPDTLPTENVYDRQISNKIRKLCYIWITNVVILVASFAIAILMGLLTVRGKKQGFANYFIWVTLLSLLLLLTAIAVMLIGISRKNVVITERAGYLHVFVVCWISVVIIFLISYFFIFSKTSGSWLRKVKRNEVVPGQFFTKEDVHEYNTWVGGLTGVNCVAVFLAYVAWRWVLRLNAIVASRLRALDLTSEAARQHARSQHDLEYGTFGPYISRDVKEIE